MSYTVTYRCQSCDYTETIPGFSLGETVLAVLQGRCRQCRGEHLSVDRVEETS